MADSKNGNHFRRFYNNEAICKAAGGNDWSTVTRVAAESGVGYRTVHKIMVLGKPDIVFGGLVKVIEASGADYGKVFDPKFYRANKPEAPEQN